MKKRIQAYMERVDQLLLNSGEELTDWEEVLREHLQQLGFYQHERIVHLLVTMLVAVLAVLTMGIGLTAEYGYAFVLTGALMVLLVPYIFHYYFLENSVQEMYRQYDQILERVRKNNG